MRFNILSTISEGAKPAELWSYNQIVAFSLKKGLKALGHEAVLVDDKTRNFKIANHSIVTSSKVLNQFRTDPGYMRALANASAGNVCLWLDSDFNGWYTPLFDRILVVCRQHKQDPQRFRYVGWAADSELFRPEQKQPMVAVDTYMRGFYKGSLDHVYDIIEDVVKDTDMQVFQPVIQYNAGRIKWPVIASGLRMSTHYIVTQPAAWGLTNIEAATCGAQLLIHKDLMAPKTWPSPLNYWMYDSAEQLRELLQRPVDVEANRKLALENSWLKVAERVMEAVA